MKIFVSIIKKIRKKTQKTNPGLEAPALSMGAHGPISLMSPTATSKLKRDSKPSLKRQLNDQCKKKMITLKRIEQIIK